MATITHTVYCKADNSIYADISFSYEEKGYDIVNNTSTVSYELKITQAGASFSKETRSDALDAAVYIDGEEIISRSMELAATPGSLSASGKTSVKHMSDGTKTVPISLQITSGSGLYTNDLWTFGAYTYSVNLALTTIPRASTATATDFTLGEAGTIQITSNSDLFTHTLQAVFQEGTILICDQTSDTSVSWTPPTNLAVNAPAGRYFQGVLDIITYYGTVVIGTNSCNINMTIPTSLKPTVESVTDEPINPDSCSDWGIYIQGISKARLTINGAKGIFGSTLASYGLYGPNFYSSKSTAITGILTSSGTQVYEGIVTDTRGLSSKEIWKDLTVVEYKPPVINSVSLQRCLADGTLSDEGTDLLANVVYTAYDCDGKNAITAKVSYRVYGTEDWTEIDTNIPSGTATVIGDSALSAESTYELKLVLKDTFNSAMATQMISTAQVVMDLKKGGNGVAVGKVSEYEKTLEVAPAWTLMFSKAKFLEQDLYPILIYPTDSEELSSFIKQTYARYTLQGNFPVAFTGTIPSSWSPTQADLEASGLLVFPSAPTDTAAQTCMAKVLLTDPSGNLYLGTAACTDTTNPYTTASISWLYLLPSDTGLKTLDTGIYYLKTAGMVTVNICRLEVTAKSSALWTKIGTLPDGYHPGHNIDFILVNQNLESDLTNGTVNGWIDQSGNIYFWTTTRSKSMSLKLSGSITYFAAS